MFSATKNFIKAEWRRFVKYAIIGGSVGGVTGGVGGYFAMDFLTKQIEGDYIEKVLPDVLIFKRPISSFVFERIMSKVKKEGAQAFLVEGVLYGTVSGCSLGAIRIGLGMGFKVLNWVFRRKTGI